MKIWQLRSVVWTLVAGFMIWTWTYTSPPPPIKPVNDFQWLEYREPVTGAYQDPDVCTVACMKKCLKELK